MNEDWESRAAVADAAVRRLSVDLGLDYSSQDWGIVNADNNRLEEFVAFLSTADELRTTVLQLIDLVLASANERLELGGEFDQKLVLGTIARKDTEMRDLSVGYWSGLDDSNEFPLAAVARYYFGRAK